VFSAQSGAFRPPGGPVEIVVRLDCDADQSENEVEVGTGFQMGACAQGGPHPVEHRGGQVQVCRAGAGQPHDPAVAASLNERFIRPQEEKTMARLKTAQEQGRISSDFDLDLAMAILSGPLYFRFLITQEPMTHDFIDRVLQALFAGMGPRP
jgi:hypothetical protein